MSSRVDPVDYLFGELGPAGRAEAERRMREDEAFRREVERLRPVVRRLESLPAEAWAPLAPPPLDILPEPAPVARRRPRWLRPVAAGAIACALLGAGVGAGLLIGSRGGGEPEGPALALRPLGAEPASAGGTARVVGRGGAALRLQVHGLRPSGKGRVYELWLMDDAVRLVALATFRVPASGAATVQVPLAIAPARYRYFDVSLEPLDGDPGHSGDSVLRGATV